MLDQEWLDQLSESEACSVYDDCRFIAKGYRRAGSFGLAAWWNLAAVQCVERIGEFYKPREADVVQLVFTDCPPRIAPELRN